MLDEFIVTNREAIIASTRTRVSSRQSPKPTDAELNNGIPAFLDQLGDALRRARRTDSIDHREMDDSAGQHGRELLRMGLSIRQVVHVYGDVCQAVTELAVDQAAPLSGEEFRTLNLCLDDAIAEAVTAYAAQREQDLAKVGTERFGSLAHELRNLLNTAMISFDLIKTGRVAPGGSTGTVHARSLMGLSALIDRSLAEVRLDAVSQRMEKISVGEFIEELEIGSLLEAQARGMTLLVTPVDRGVTISGDRQVLAAAMTNMLLNAFKFTRPQGNVSLSTRLTTDRVLFDIEDECGGLPPGEADILFRPFEQRGDDRSGVGLGLSICMDAARANGGGVSVRDIPGRGCVFTLDLPRVPQPG